jgi:4-hydroxy 2-oxovalerate aldolase
MRESLNSNQILDYGCNISSGVMDISDRHCIIPFELAIAYALSISIAGNANKIYLAGFDGFEIYDPRQDEMLEVFRLFKSISSIPIISITKTNYPLEKRTIHDPSI